MLNYIYNMWNQSNGKQQSQQVYITLIGQVSEGGSIDKIKFIQQTTTRTTTTNNKLQLQHRRQ